MKFQKSVTTLVAIMALAAANTAFATVLCRPWTDLGNGLVEMDVAISAGLRAVPTFNLSGAAVSADVADCTIGATACTVSAQGTPGGGFQLVTFQIPEVGDSTPAECAITQANGLPVELNKFSVE